MHAPRALASRSAALCPAYVHGPSRSGVLAYRGRHSPHSAPSAPAAGAGAGGPAAAEGRWPVHRPGSPRVSSPALSTPAPGPTPTEHARNNTHRHTHTDTDTHTRARSLSLTARHLYSHGCLSKSILSKPPLGCVSNTFVLLKKTKNVSLLYTTRRDTSMPHEVHTKGQSFTLHRLELGRGERGL